MSEKKRVFLEKCPDPEAYVEFQMKSTLVKESLSTSDTLS